VFAVFALLLALFAVVVAPPTAPPVITPIISPLPTRANTCSSIPNIALVCNPTTCPTSAISNSCVFKGKYAPVGNSKGLILLQFLLYN